MDQQPMTCERVDQLELDRRYVAGQLGEEEAAAFEAHYFECDRCWALVKGGAGVRAAHAGGGAAAVARPRRWLKPLALAAGLAIAVFGTWRVLGTDNADAPDAIRGARDSIAVQTGMADGHWQAAWGSVPEAVSYQVRLFSGDGRLLMTRELNDTLVRLPADSLATMARGDTLYLEVQRFDRLRRPVARSPLIPLPPRGPSR